MSDVTTSATTVGNETDADPRRWSILAVVVLAQLMVVLDASIVTIALPSAQKALGISVANRQWVITAYTWRSAGCFCSAVVSPTSGDANECSSSA